MKEVFIVSDNIYSPLGNTSEENFNLIKKGISGLKCHDDKSLSSSLFFASLFDKQKQFLDPDISNSFTKFEQMLIASISEAIKDSGVNLQSNKTGIIISSTKGNVSLIENKKMTKELAAEVSLANSAKKVSEYFGNPNKPIVVSNACISSLVGILIAKRMIQFGQFESVVVAGADEISRFILSGFESFQAISATACRPFDAERNGINLGEAAATIILSSDKNLSRNKVIVAGGSISNDANHISGPSMTGEELNIAIQRSLKEANLTSENIDLVSAHGTATVYNDEMEAKAFSLAKITNVPMNSLKGYFGHTLGAAGLVESIISIRSMEEQIIIPSKGMNKLGVSISLNVCTEIQSAKINHCLKTASGFGGCNAAVIFSLNNN